jgi:glycosyltransferase involved in cell wall biosynthesis
LSAFSRSKFVAAGFPAGRIAVKPNFAEDRPVGGSRARAGALYVGRLSAEKGIAILLRAWEGLDIPLRLVGDGPLRGSVERAMSAKIVVTGWKTPGEVAEEMARADFLVLPSVWAEISDGGHRGILQGLSVIASRLPALEEIIEDGAKGLFFAAGDAGDLASKVRWASEHPAVMRDMGLKARGAYEKKYSPAVNLAQLTKIYEAAIAEVRTAARWTNDLRASWLPHVFSVVRDEMRSGGRIKSRAGSDRPRAQ